MINTLDLAVVDYLIFDNSYSWTATKKLFYLVDVYADEESYEKECAESTWVETVAPTSELTKM